MARTKTNTQNNTKPRRTPRRNRHLDKNYFFGLFTDQVVLPWSVNLLTFLGRSADFSLPFLSANLTGKQ